MTIRYELVIHEKGNANDDYTISKHRTLKDAEKALVKFKASRIIASNAMLRVVRVDSGSD